MPNGHGIPLGCFVCKQYEKGKPNPLMGRCQLHKIDVNMDLVCADFDNSINNVNHSAPLTEGILYAFVDVQGHGYPPPTELVPLAKIFDYKGWNNKQREQVWLAARKQANTMFEKRK